MPSDSLWRHVFRRLQERTRSGREEEETAACKLLKRVPIFQNLTGRELHKIEQMLYGPRDWRPHEAIVNQGDPGMGMYIVISGQVRVAQMGDDGGEQQLATLTPGDFFGEQALVDESPRPASACAVLPCSLLFFCRSDLLELLENNTPLALKIIGGLAQELSADVSELIEKLAVQLRTPERLLKEAQRAGNLQ